MGCYTVHNLLGVIEQQPCILHTRLLFDYYGDIKTKKDFILFQLLVVLYAFPNLQKYVQHGHLDHVGSKV
jgi:hypothetical protein